MQTVGGLLLDTRETAVAPRLLVPGWSEFSWLVHGFSTRLGGVSENELASLNLGLQVGDQPARVQSNRERWAATLGTGTWPAVYMQQVHGSEIAVVDRGGIWLSTDGVVTKTPGLILHVLVADCLPVLLVDPVSRAVGAVHAGWRGTVSGIVNKAVQTMANQLGADPRNIQACLGPGIGGCCYLVDEPVIARVRELPVDWQSAISTDEVLGQYRLDLFELNRLLLIGAGLAPECIFSSGLCTLDQAELFYSYRRDSGATGRLVGSIGLIDGENAGFPAVDREVEQQTDGDGDESIVG